MAGESPNGASETVPDKNDDNDLINEKLEEANLEDKTQDISNGIQDISDTETANDVSVS